MADQLGRIDGRLDRIEGRLEGHDQTRIEALEKRIERP
jgi:hypothetical protein